MTDQPTHRTRVAGRVQPGKGDASRWLARFNAAYARKVGTPVYPGSLNLALPEAFDWFAPAVARRTVWCGREEYGGERDVLLVPCRLVRLGAREASEPAWLWTTTTAARARPDPWVVEVIAAVPLRRTYGLADGAVVELELLEPPPDAPPDAPTPYPELNGVLAELVARLRGALGARLVGVYLQGSFAVGDFDQDSDVDFVVATDGPLDAPTVAALQAVHAAVYALPSEWARHLEGSYFPRDVLRRGDRCGEPLWYLDHGAQHLIASDHCNTLLVRRIVRECGIALTGPPPRALVDPVSDAVLRQEIYATMTGWGREILAEPARYRNRFYQGYLVLNYARMLHDLRRGRPGSKRAGAEWSKAHFGPAWADLIDAAWATRPDPARSVRTPADPAAFARTLQFLELVLTEAHAAAAQSREAHG